MAATYTAELPDLPAAPVDLSDAELQELDELLAATPAPLQPMDVVMLDGYLCGVLVQPTLIGAAEWLPRVFDLEGHPLPVPADHSGYERARALTLRRHTALNRALLDEGWFEPLILEEGDVEPGTLPPPEDDAAASLHPVSRPLMPWVLGFQFACSNFPALLQMTEPEVMSALARLFRHLPATGDDERKVVSMMDRVLPLTTLDDAIEDLVASVADLAELTHDARYRVETVQREAPKLGRNDACHCGSGKKFKKCHGALN